MAIKKTWKDVYDSVLDLSHTGDVNWQTALSVTSKGEAEIHLGMSVSNVGEIKITVDGNVLHDGVIGRDYGNTDYVFEIEWNKSFLLEYRTNNLAQTVYLDVNYYSN